MGRTKKISDEDKLKSELDRVEFRLFNVPEPTYKFDVGDSVRVGNLKDCIVAEVLHDGKVYKIDYTSVDNNYGNPIETKHRKGYWTWLEVRPNRNNIDDSFTKDVPAYLQLNYSQRNMSGLLYIVYFFGLNFDPEYQRGYVWDDEDKISLIDSVFNNVDIGKFVFVKLNNEEWNANGRRFGYEILDGKQRLRALCDFYENRFQYKGKFYNDLSRQDRYHFEDYPISYADVEHVTNEQKLNLFIKLNTTGRVMDKNHLDKVKQMVSH